MARKKKKAAKKKTAKRRAKRAPKHSTPLASMAKKVTSIDSRLHTVESKMFSGKKRNKHGGHTVHEPTIGSHDYAD